jgi:hypothetical protein
MKEPTARTRKRLVEGRLKRFATLTLDAGKVRASRDFHIEHWLELAEAAIRANHRELFYEGLSPNVEEAVAGHPEQDLPPDLQASVLEDLAFMQGHLEAFREVLQMLSRARRPKPLRKAAGA